MWGPIAAACPEVQCDGFSFRRLWIWRAGVASVYGLIFGFGNLVLGETVKGLLLLGVALLLGAVVFRELKRPALSGG